MNAGSDSRSWAGCGAAISYCSPSFWGFHVVRGYWLLPVIFLSPILFSVLLFFLSSRFWRDWLNPLTLVLFVGLIRFSVPGFLSLRTDPDFPVFQIMGLERDTWILGHALALAGLLGVALGWLMPMHLSGSGRNLPRIGAIRICAHLGGFLMLPCLGMLIGFAALVLFVGSHVSVSDAVSTGEMRGTEIRAGTGKYFHLSLMLIASSVVFSAYLIERRYSWWITSLPAVVAAASFWVLGGRVRAFVPMACVALLLWYRRNELKVPVRTGFALTLILLPVFSYVGQLYRGGIGLEAFARYFQCHH